MLLLIPMWKPGEGDNVLLYACKYDRLINFKRKENIQVMLVKNERELVSVALIRQFKMVEKAYHENIKINTAIFLFPYTNSC